MWKHYSCLPLYFLITNDLQLDENCIFWGWNGCDKSFRKRRGHLNNQVYQIRVQIFDTVILHDRLIHHWTQCNIMEHMESEWELTSKVLP